LVFPETDAVMNSQQRWRIVFMGTPEFAVPSLEALIRGRDEVVAVVCQPDRAAGRGQRVSQPPVKQAAMSHQLPVAQFTTLRDPAVHEAIARWRPDLVVVAAYGKILPPPVLAIPPHGCINVHASLLPRHRGAAPIQWAVLCGDRETGISIMQMNAAMDAGDILLQRAIPIDPADTAATLAPKLAEIGAAALLDAVEALKAGTLMPVPQDVERATRAPRIDKAMGRIDWTSPAQVIERAVRAFQPWPTAYTLLESKHLKVLRAHVEAARPAGDVPAAGTVLQSEPAGIRVATGEGTLVLTVVQLEGHRSMSVADFIRGHAIRPGSVLGN
jgi:methionyl-tRNA formyltransferase